MNRLVLIDGNAILHRAFHALPPMRNSKGIPTNAVYGFVAMLLNTIDTLKPSHLAVAFDRPKPTFRKKLYKEYQSHRPEMDDQLVPQVKSVHEVVEAMDIPIYELDGYEADDVLGSIAEQVKNLKKEKIDEVVIVTGDRDLLQLVNAKVKLFMPVKGMGEGKLYGNKETKERMGVEPKQIIDLKALMGDASDNYPGVSGIGPKTAVSLIERFGSVNKLYEQLDKVEKASVKEKLERDKDNAFLSYKLATVVTDAPVKLDILHSQLPKDLLTTEVIKIFGKLGFKTLLRRLSRMAGKEIKIEKNPPTHKASTSAKATADKSEGKENNSEQMGLF